MNQQTDFRSCEMFGQLAFPCLDDNSIHLCGDGVRRSLVFWWSTAHDMERDPDATVVGNCKIDECSPEQLAAARHNHRELLSI